MMGACVGGQGFGVNSGVGLEVLRVLTGHPDSPQAASGDFPGAGSHKFHCSPLLDMGFGLVWRSPTLSPRRTTVRSRGEGIRGSLLLRVTGSGMCVHSQPYGGITCLNRKTLAQAHTCTGDFCGCIAMSTCPHIYTLQ
jgi:hypothetical protein